jgi:hypothetical protein
MEYIYFRIYKQLRRVKSNDTPGFNALILLIILQSLNILSLFGIVNYFIKVSLFKNQVLIITLCLFVLLFLANFRYFFRKQKDIYERYINESDTSNKKGTAIVLVYIVFSLIIFFLIGETLV